MFVTPECRDRDTCASSDLVRGKVEPIRGVSDGNSTRPLTPSHSASSTTVTWNVERACSTSFLLFDLLGKLTIRSVNPISPVQNLSFVHCAISSAYAWRADLVVRLHRDYTLVSQQPQVKTSPIIQMLCRLFNHYPIISGRLISRPLSRRRHCRHFRPFFRAQLALNFSTHLLHCTLTIVLSLHSSSPVVLRGEHVIINRLSISRLTG